MESVRTHVPLETPVPGMQSAFHRTIVPYAVAQTTWLETPSSTVTRSQFYPWNAAVILIVPAIRHA